MKKYNILIVLLLLFSCGRPHSTDQESNEVVARERLAILSQDYQEVIGNYSGTFEIIEDHSLYNAKLELRIIQDLDPNTNLPLKLKIIGTLVIFELIDGQHKILATYGITDGTYDRSGQLIALDIQDKFKLRAEANSNVLNGTLHSSIKGDVAIIKLVRNL